MNTKIYVENLPVTATESELMDLFSTYGNVADVNIVVDRTNQEPCGFGFVTMGTPEGASSAIRALNGKALGICTLSASEAWPTEERPGSPNGKRRPRRRASHLY